MPKQLVYDQDSVIVVSENNGDIIHTHAFAAFLQETKLDVLVCRKSDPQSKGKIEAVVRFIKVTSWRIAFSWGWISGTALLRIGLSVRGTVVSMIRQNGSPVKCFWKNRCIYGHCSA